MKKSICIIMILICLCTSCGVKEQTYFTGAKLTPDSEEESGGEGQDIIRGNSDENANENVVKDEVSEDTEENPVIPDTIYVHICGEVQNPGVYELDDNSRVFDAVEAAGGMTEEADASAINLVRFVEDEQQIYIPAVGEEARIEQAETGNHSEQSPVDGLVNINQADREELCTINGIGETRAEAIIQYREEYGEFESASDIMKVNGIKDSLYQKIKDQIRVR